MSLSSGALGSIHILCKHKGFRLSGLDFDTENMLTRVIRYLKGSKKPEKHAYIVYEWSLTDIIHHLGLL